MFIKSLSCARAMVGTGDRMGNRSRSPWEHEAPLSRDRVWPSRNDDTACWGRPRPSPMGLQWPIHVITTASPRGVNQGAEATPAPTGGPGQSWKLGLHTPACLRNSAPNQPSTRPRAVTTYSPTDKQAHTTQAL